MKKVSWLGLLVGPSNQPKSVLSDLTSTERAALNEWSAGQTGNPERDGALN